MCIELRVDAGTQRRHQRAQPQQRPVHVHARMPVVAAAEDRMDVLRQRVIVLVEDQVVQLVRIAPAHDGQGAFGEALGAGEHVALRIVCRTRQGGGFHATRLWIGRSFFTRSRRSLP